jgi:hypothetical protein
MNGYYETAIKYIRSSRNVVDALDILQTAISDGDLDEIEFASDELARTADSYLGHTTQQQAFGFDEMAAVPATNLFKREQIASDLLVGVLLDLEMANTLVIAGQLVGETAGPASVEDLNEVRDQLDSLIIKVAPPLTGSVDTLSKTARFGFDETPKITLPPASSNLATAKANFEKCAMETLEGLVAETRKVLDAAFKTVGDWDEAALNKAIGMVGECIDDLPWLGKLTNKGLLIAVQALQKLSKLLGLRHTKLLQEYAEEIIKQIKAGGELLGKFLIYTYGMDKMKLRVRELLEKTSTNVSQIDGGARELINLKLRFTEDMAMVTRLINLLDVGKKTVGKLLPEAAGILLFGAFYIVAMDYALLAGMDFADTTTIITLVEGIIETSEAVLG